MQNGASGVKNRRRSDKFGRFFKIFDAVFLGGRKLLGRLAENFSKKLRYFVA